MVVRGGNNLDPLYGSVTNPLALGSGGHEGGAGGAILLTVNGKLSLDGTLSANGVYGVHGAGSGGSIWIRTDHLTGTGLLAANGGNADSQYSRAGGGGGRVSVEYNTSTFTGDFSVQGGSGGSFGFNGTLSIPQPISLTLNYGIGLVPGIYHFPYLELTNNASISCQSDTNSTEGSGVVINCSTGRYPYGIFHLCIAGIPGSTGSPVVVLPAWEAHMEDREQTIQNLSMVR